MSSYVREIIRWTVLCIFVLKIHIKKSEAMQLLFAYAVRKCNPDVMDVQKLLLSSSVFLLYFNSKESNNIETCRDG